MCIPTDGTEIVILAPIETISNNGIAQVWRANDGYIYKHSIPFLTENEFFFLSTLSSTGYTPHAERVDKYTIKMQDLGKSEGIINLPNFIAKCHNFLNALGNYGIIHGDLTAPHIIIKNNHPYIIDWAESRLFCERRENKRPGTDAEWLQKFIRNTVKDVE